MAQDKKVKLVAITGSLCTGKSQVLDIFANNGIPIFNSDEEIRGILDNNSIVISKIADRYPDVIVKNKIDRRNLSKIVFKNSEELNWLENIVYPLLFKRHDDFIKNNANKEILALEIPLLYEKKLSSRYDFVVVTYVCDEKKKARAKKRGMSEDVVESILSKQLSDEYKKFYADFHIDTSYNYDEVKGRVLKIIQKVMKHK